MKTSAKDKVLSWLESHKGEFVSGGKLAEELVCSRNAVWKAVHALVEDGYAVESVTGKGYRLAADTSILSAASIARYIANPAIVLEYHRCIDSTNNRCKQLAAEGAPQGTFVVADHQSAGRGRQGRPFFSPPDSGIYLSLLLRPDFPVGDVALVTSFAAVAVAESIEALFNKKAQIKWVNDVFVDGHKVCGILTEASFDAESGSVDYLVVGIGINVYPPEGGFPDEVAGAVSDASRDAEDLRARLAARIGDALMAGASELPKRAWLAAYRSRSLLDGRDVDVYARGSEKPRRAHVIGVNDDFTLQVEYESGEQAALSSGEVHIPSSQL